MSNTEPISYPQLNSNYFENNGLLLTAITLSQKTPNDTQKTEEHCLRSLFLLSIPPNQTQGHILIKPSLLTTAICISVNCESTNSHTQVTQKTYQTVFVA